MSTDDRNVIIKKIKLIIIESGLPGIYIKLSRECVCPMSVEKCEDSISLSIEKSFGPDKKELVDSFKIKVEAVISGIENIKMDVKIQLGPGCKYDNIKGVVPVLKDCRPVHLKHKEGDVWFINFWASWCPPSQAPM